MRHVQGVPKKGGFVLWAQLKALNGLKWQEENIQHSILAIGV